jgi:hypothetical protein
MLTGFHSCMFTGWFLVWSQSMEQRLLTTEGNSLRIQARCISSMISFFLKEEHTHSTVDWQTQLKCEERAKLESSCSYVPRPVRWRTATKKFPVIVNLPIVFAQHRISKLALFCVVLSRASVRLGRRRHCSSPWRGDRGRCNNSCGFYVASQANFWCASNITTNWLVLIISRFIQYVFFFFGEESIVSTHQHTVLNNWLMLEKWSLIGVPLVLPSVLLDPMRLNVQFERGMIHWTGMHRPPYKYVDLDEAMQPSRSLRKQPVWGGKCEGIWNYRNHLFNFWAY